MDYPLWESASLFDAMLVRALYVAHVVVVLAMSGMALIMAFEMRRARLSGDGYTERVLRNAAIPALALPFFAAVALAFIVGAYASLVVPATVSAFVHIFMWAGVLFAGAMIVQTIAVFGILWGWEKLTSRHHQLLLWVNAAAAFFWLAVLAAGASFAVTPGRWLETYAFGDALINRTCIPLFVVSIAPAAALGAALFIVIVNASRSLTAHERHDMGLRLTRWLWTLPAAIPIAILLIMALPQREVAFEAPLVAGGMMLTVAAAMYLALAHRSKQARIAFPGALLAAVMFVAACVLFIDGFRALGGPFTIRGYIYRNDVAVADAPRYARAGILSRTGALPDVSYDLARIPPERRGALVYRALRYDRWFGRDGHMLTKRLSRLDIEDITVMLRHIELIDREAPPFIGTERELNDLATFLAVQTRRSR